MLVSGRVGGFIQISWICVASKLGENRSNWMDEHMETEMGGEKPSTNN